MASTIYDITMIGGGPIGVFAAGLAGEMGAMCNVIESRLHLGGVMMAAYPDKEVYNFPGIQLIKGRDLINMLTEKARSFGLTARLGEYVNQILKGSNNTLIIKTNKQNYLSSTAIITTGLKAFYSPMVDSVQAESWESAGISESWPDPDLIRNKAVGVIDGSGNAQIPIIVRNAARSIVFIIDEYYSGGQKVKLKSTEKAKISIVRSPWKLSRITADRNVKNLQFLNTRTGEEKQIPVDVVVALYDDQARQTLYSNFGIEMIGQQVKVDQRMQTSLKRVFAAGDIAWYPGKIKMLSAGINEATTAVKSALKSL